MIINDLDTPGIAIALLKTDLPLLVDADTSLDFAVTGSVLNLSILWSSTEGYSKGFPVF